MKESLYKIPQDCICVGDGLFGAKCGASRHARLKKKPPAILDAVTDVVLSYRPKAKVKKARKRKKRKKHGS
jgi:competence transcription factor ComK